MDLRTKWWQYDALCRLAEHLSDLEVWAFGSALYQEHPGDLDVLLIYDDRTSVVAIRSVREWTETCPSCDIIAMTRTEECEYRFIQTTGAVRLL